MIIPLLKKKKGGEEMFQKTSECRHTSMPQDWIQNSEKNTTEDVLVCTRENRRERRYVYITFSNKTRIRDYTHSFYNH